MADYTEDDLNQAQQKHRPKGAIPHLPKRDAPISEWRDWLTRAFAMPKGYRFDKLERHGRRLANPATITFLTPAGGRVSFEFPEQRGLARGANLRATVVSVTDGLCRMPHLSNPECSDVWVALCSLATVLLEQDERDETRDWIEKFLAICKIEDKRTLEPAGRYDTLTTLKDHGNFERRDAQALLAPPSRAWDWTTPILVLDSVTGRRWIRVAELACYVRHVIGTSLGDGVLDGRLIHLGAQRLTYESRNGAKHPRISFYLLPEDALPDPIP